MLLKKSKKVKIIFLAFAVFSLMLCSVLITSCGGDKGVLDSTKAFHINMPRNAILTVSNIRIKGFTLSWPELSGDCEYAIAVSHNGNIEDYRTALENDHIVLDFTPGKTLKGTYKVTKMIAGKDYEIKLFARKKNTQAAEYLSARAVLPYIDEAELLKVFIDEEELPYDKTEDSFIKSYFPGKSPVQEYTVTYKLARLCELYIDGVKIEDGEFILKDGESVIVTAVNEKNGAARDYIIGVMPIDNGLPVISINIEDSRPVTSSNVRLDAEMTMLDSTSNPSGNYAKGLYKGAIEIRRRGSSSLPKISYNIYTDKKVGILDMAPSREWTLISNFADKTLMRSYIAYELYRDMGAIFSPKFRFVDLMVNGDYMGTYCFGERVKIDEGRLDLPKITTKERVITRRKGTLVFPPTSGDDLNGSYVLEVDSTDKYSKDDIIFETKKINWRQGHYFAIKQPGEKNMTVEAYDFISGYVNDTENALFSDNFKDPENGYRKYIDASTFIDWYIINELFKNVNSAFNTNVYMYKPRNEKLCMGPVWDSALGGGNADYSGCENPEGWYVRNTAWFSRLFEDETFAQEFKDRWNFVKANYFDKTFDRIDKTAEHLEKSQSMNFDRWPILGVYIWPNAGDVESRPTYKSEVDYLKEWLTARIEWMDSEINK